MSNTDGTFTLKPLREGSTTLRANQAATPVSNAAPEVTRDIKVYALPMPSNAQLVADEYFANATLSWDAPGPATGVELTGYAISQTGGNNLDISAPADALSISLDGVDFKPDSVFRVCAEYYIEELSRQYESDWATSNYLYFNPLTISAPPAGEALVYGVPVTFKARASVDTPQYTLWPAGGVDLTGESVDSGNGELSLTLVPRQVGAGAFGVSFTSLTNHSD